MTGSGGDEPAWSSDGTRVAYASGGIYTMRADGTRRKQLTKGLDESPSWSPSGRQLVFARYRSNGGPSAIFRINADGTKLTRLTAWAIQRLDPAWSPNGSKIAYVNGFHIATMNPDGSGKTDVPNQPPDAFEPAWSPQGDKFAFSGGNGCYDIYTINTDGSGLTRLTPYSCKYAAGARVDHNPSWSPDGTQIVFDRSGGTKGWDTAVVRMNADGSNLTRLTGWSAEAHDPFWGPAVPWCAGRSATVIGTAADDSVVGTAGSDVVVGLGGNDTIFGNAGNDILCGGTGADKISGGEGNDTIVGGFGDDTLRGGDGADTLHGNAANDRIYGNAGNDTLVGGPGDDVLYGGWGTDELYGGTGTDALHS